MPTDPRGHCLSRTGMYWRTGIKKNITMAISTPNFIVKIKPNIVET
jgi:hypothetical protein